MSASKPPAGLGAAGRKLWRDVHRSWEWRPDEELVLEHACRTLDELERLEGELRKAAAIVEGSKGQPRGNPLLGEIRSHRLALQRLLAGLEFEEVDRSAGAARSHAGRQLARRRWSGRLKAAG